MWPKFFNMSENTSIFIIDVYKQEENMNLYIKYTYQIPVEIKIEDAI